LAHSLRDKVSRLMNSLEKAKGHDARSKLRKKIYALGPKAAPLLIPYLKSEDDFLRWELVSFLGDFAEPTTMKALINFAINEDEVHARWRSFWAVTRFDKVKSRSILLRQLHSKKLIKNGVLL